MKLFFPRRIRRSMPLMTGLAVILCMALESRAEEYLVEAVLKCTNQPFQSDAVLVTTHDVPLEFHCLAAITPAPPKGYVPAPGEWTWTVTSGTVAGNIDQAVWNDPSPGLQTLTVSGVIKYLPPKQGWLSFSTPPTVEVPFSASIDCIVPYYVPEIKNGFVNDFSIGEYPDPLDPDDLARTGDAIVAQRVKDNAHIYQPPELFYEVTHETYFIKVFKNYVLGDFDLDPRFLSLKYPRYIAIHPYILRKIDLLEQQLAADGRPVEKLKIFYGFRSPGYNLGQRGIDGELTLKSPFSMHMYGMAIDFIIDQDDNLVLDDLDGDGAITEADADVIMESVNALDRRLRDAGSELVGGAGPYPHHDYYERGEVVQTPYVHIDTRGHLREDGTLIRWTGKDAIGVRDKAKPYTPKAPIPQWPWRVPAEPGE